MKVKHIGLLVLPLLAVGCMNAPRAPERWNITFDDQVGVAGKVKRLGGVARIESVVVRAPYAVEHLAVLRPDGTIVFDAYNTYASMPGMMLRGEVYDAVEASGKFDNVITGLSTAKSDYLIEVVVTDMFLDCREEGKRVARVALILSLIREGRELVRNIHGEGAAAYDGNVATAMSSAFAQAMNDALAK